MLIFAHIFPFPLRSSIELNYYFLFDQIAAHAFHDVSRKCMRIGATQIKSPKQRARRQSFLASATFYDNFNRNVAERIRVGPTHRLIISIKFEYDDYVGSSFFRQFDWHQHNEVCLVDKSRNDEEDAKWFKRVRRVRWERSFVFNRIEM